MEEANDEGRDALIIQLVHIGSIIQQAVDHVRLPFKLFNQ